MTVLEVLAPVQGTVVALADVEDPVFSAALVGPGLAIDPRRGGRVQAVSPIAGRIVKLHPHAYVIQTRDGSAVLTHLGVDTVQLSGEGFELHVAEGVEVAAGALVATWDPEAVEASGRSPVVPVVALDAKTQSITGQHTPDSVNAGDILFTWTVGVR